MLQAASHREGSTNHSFGTALRQIAAGIQHMTETPARKPYCLDLAGVAGATTIISLLLAWLPVRDIMRAWSGIALVVTGVIITVLWRVALWFRDQGMRLGLATTRSPVQVWDTIEARVRLTRHIARRYAVSCAATLAMWLACTGAAARDLVNFAAAIAFPGMIAYWGQSPRAPVTSRNHCRTLIASRANLGHGRVLTFGAKTGFRCLPARSFYRTIRQETSLLKPARSPLAAVAELMVPEYVRSNSGSNSLASEAGEIHFDRGCLRIDCPPLPPRIRRSRATRHAGGCHFVEGLPIRVETQAPSFQPPISLIPIGERAGTAPFFRAELQQHALSRAELIASRVVFVAARDEHFPWAAKVFGSFARSLPNPINPRQIPDSYRLTDYFRLETARRPAIPAGLIPSTSMSSSDVGWSSEMHARSAFLTFGARQQSRLWSGILTRLRALARPGRPLSSPGECLGALTSSGRAEPQNTCKSPQNAESPLSAGFLARFRFPFRVPASETVLFASKCGSVRDARERWVGPGDGRERPRVSCGSAARTPYSRFRLLSEPRREGRSRPSPLARPKAVLAASTSLLLAATSTTV